MVLFFYALNGLPDECCNKESKMFEVIWSPRQDKFIIRPCRILHNDPEIVGTLEQCQAWVSRLQNKNY
jgi:hypothetical protein